MPFKLQPPSIHGLWQDYRNHCDSHADMKLYRGKLIPSPRKLIYTIEGFCLFACITQRDLEKYERDKNYRRLIKQMRYESLCRKLDALINGEGCTRGLLFDLKNNHGMDGRRINPNEDLWITMKLHDGPGGTKISGPNGETEFPKEEEEEDGLWPEPPPSSPPFSVPPCGREGGGALTPFLLSTSGEGCCEEHGDDYGEEHFEEPCQCGENFVERVETILPEGVGIVAGLPDGHANKTSEDVGLNGEQPSADAGLPPGPVCGPSAIAGAFEVNQHSGASGESTPPPAAGEERPGSIYEWVGKPRRMLWR